MFPNVMGWLNSPQVSSHFDGDLHFITSFVLSQKRKKKQQQKKQKTVIISSEMFCLFLELRFQ